MTLVGWMRLASLLTVALRDSAGLVAACWPVARAWAPLARLAAITVLF